MKPQRTQRAQRRFLQVFSVSSVLPVVFAASFILAMLTGWLGAPIDNYAYDWMFRKHPPAPRSSESIILAVDEDSLSAMDGQAHLRGALGRALEQIAPAGPKVVAIDVIFADKGDASENAALEAGLARTPRLVLPDEVIGEGDAAHWEEPVAQFRKYAAAVGHVHGPADLDGISRAVPLEQVAAGGRRWALALEAFRLSRGGGPVLETPNDIQIGSEVIPAVRADSRTIRIRFLPPDAAVPRISLKELRDKPELARQFAGKVVFVGVTAQSAARDRMYTPYSYGSYMTGIEIHANIFETLARGEFLVSAPELAVFLATLGITALGVLAFVLRTGWQAYAAAGLVLAAAHIGPYALFTRGIVFSYLAPVAAAWFSSVGAGSWQFVKVRRQLRKAEEDRSRYQQAMHFVTHEMKTPLTAIQGSSELMTRFNLSEDKRKQIASMIHTESRRLAKMIETFLNVERLSAGQMELKRAPFPLGELVCACLERARPLAERKQIRITPVTLPEAILEGDRELMEYAIYNLLNNAVKYSPQETEVVVSGRVEAGILRLSVKDQGIGMEQDEVRKIFQKFYRTRRAMASGESGTGIGLSIVDQIITHHGGRIEVSSAPGKGSCFTVVMPVVGSR